MYKFIYKKLFLKGKKKTEKACGLKNTKIVTILPFIEKVCQALL